MIPTSITSRQTATATLKNVSKSVNPSCLIKIAKRFLIVLGLFSCLTACSSDEPYLYDKPGFDEGFRPEGVVQNPGAPQRVMPRYYGVPRPVPVPVPYYVPHPGSRYYSNPYDIPAAPYGYANYDADQYYVPPTYYQNVEPQPKMYKNVPGSGAF